MPISPSVWSKLSATLPDWAKSSSGIGTFCGQALIIAVSPVISYLRRQTFPYLLAVEITGQQALLCRIAQGQLDGGAQGDVADEQRVAAVGGQRNRGLGVPEHPQEFRDQIRMPLGQLAPDRDHVV